MAKHKILWQHFPKHSPCSDFLKEVVGCFDAVSADIASLDNVGQVSNDVLAKVRGGLEGLGFLVETSKTAEGKIRFPFFMDLMAKLKKHLRLMPIIQHKRRWLKLRQVAELLIINSLKTFSRLA